METLFTILGIFAVGGLLFTLPVEVLKKRYERRYSRRGSSATVSKKVTVYVPQIMYVGEDV